MAIRIASPNDAEELVPLFIQLGYSSTAHQIRGRLERNQPSHYVSWVFEEEQASSIVRLGKQL